MNKFTLISALAGLSIMATSCATVSSNEQENLSTPESIQSPIQCKVENFQSFVGQQLTPEVTDKIRAQSSTIRVLKPNQPATMDYNEARVNIHVDDGDLITMITCG